MSDPPVFVPRTSRKRCQCSTPLEPGAACAGGGDHFFIDPCGKASAKMGKGEFQSVVRECAAWERTTETCNGRPGKRSRRLSMVTPP